MVSALTSRRPAAPERTSIEQQQLGRRSLRWAKRATLSAYGLCLIVELILLAFDPSIRWGELAWSLGMQALVGLVLTVPPPPQWRVTPAIGVLLVVVYLGAIAMLRDAAGPIAGFGPLVLLPVIFSTLRGRRVEFGVGVVGVALVYVLPAFLIGAPRYPTGTWRAGLLFVVISGVIGVAVLRLVERVGALLDRLAILARTDELTGLANRRAWDEALEHGLALTRRSGRPLTVALLDLDDFKALNDTVGHLAGDRMLRAAAAKWRGELREADTLARWGGDEFAVLLIDCDQAEAGAVIERMRASELSPPFSAGFSSYRAGATGAELLAEADAELYRVKRAGRAPERQAAMPAAPEVPR